VRGIDAVPVIVKIEYIDDLAVVEAGTRAEEKQNFLFVYDAGGAVAARFNSSKVEYWWTGSIMKPEKF
jgi:hypothetical protein